MQYIRIIVLLMFLSLLFTLTQTTPAAAVNYPKYSGYLNDYANILSPNDELELNRKISVLKSETSVEIAIVTVGSLQGLPVDQYTIGLANQWGVGNAEYNNGVILLIAPNERKAHLHFGIGYSANFSLATSRDIIDNIVVANFKRKQPVLAITRATDAIIAAVRDYVPGTNWQPSNNQSTSNTSSSNNYQSSTINDYSRPVTDNYKSKKSNAGAWGLLLLGLAGLTTVIFTSIYYQQESKRLLTEALMLRDEFNKKYFDIWERTTRFDVEQLIPLEDFIAVGANIPSYLDIVNQLDSEISSLKGGANISNRTNLRNIVKQMEDCNQAINQALTLPARLKNAKEKCLGYPSIIKKHLSIAEDMIKLKDVPIQFTNQFIDAENTAEQFEKKSKQEKCNWLQLQTDFETLLNEIDQISVDSEQASLQAAEAREKGPALLEEMKNKLQELELKANTHQSSSARDELEQARNKYNQAYNMIQYGNNDWTLAYLLLMQSQNHCVTTEHYYHQEDSPHSDFSSFFGSSGDSGSSGGSFSGGSFGGSDSGGGGGDSGGGGSSGSW